MPSLHAITFRRNYVINKNTTLSGNEIIKFSDFSDEFKETKEKLIAVLKLFVNNDKIAAEYILFSLISKVY